MAPKIIVKGGIPLQGEVEVSGSKNSTLPIMAATLLSSDENILTNVPDLADVHTMGKLLGYIGAEVEFAQGRLCVNIKGTKSPVAPYDLVKTMRASVLVLGPLVSRFGEAKVSLPGGCAIGARPINLHLRGLEKMGASIEIEQGYVKVTVPLSSGDRRLKGTRIYFDTPTVTGTENLMMAATIARGTTIIENAACEPEVSDLANFLNRMGADISGAGTDIIIINGVDNLKGTQYSVMKDRIEAGTYLVAAAITKGNVLIKGCNSQHLDSVVLKLREADINVVEEGNGLRVKARGRARSLNIKTMPYPGFPTDMQAQMMALLSLAEGTSVITETIFENRFIHVAELRRMGADISLQGNTAIIRGVEKLCGAPVMATDLRASASLILAGLAAEGETEVTRIYHLDRGYERMEEKLSSLGADIRRVR